MNIEIIQTTFHICSGLFLRFIILSCNYSKYWFLETGAFELTVIINFINRTKAKAPPELEMQQTQFRSYHIEVLPCHVDNLNVYIGSTKGMATTTPRLAFKMKNIQYCNETPIKGPYMIDILFLCENTENCRLLLLEIWKLRLHIFLKFFLAIMVPI